MIRLKLFGFPIRIRWMFWLLCALIGWSNLRDGTRFGFVMFGIVTATILISVIWHELGHAFARRKFGAPFSEITLWGAGGYCAGPGSFTKNQSIWISFAGPLHNFILGGLLLILWFTPLKENVYLGGDGKVLGGQLGFLQWAFIVNFGWGIMNLLPVLPLDGGRIFAALLSNQNAGLVLWTGLIVSIMIVILGIMTVRPFFAVLFGFMAYENLKMIRQRRHQTYR